jgi:hypothetical protein
VLLLFPNIKLNGKAGIHMEKKKLVSRADIKQYIKENNLKSVEDIQNVLKDLCAETLQEMLGVTRGRFLSHNCKGNKSSNDLF